MTAPLTIEIKGLDRILRTVRDEPRLIVAPLRSAMEDLSLLAQREAIANAPRDTAGLQRSIMREVKPMMARVYTNLQYAPVMEYGRRPGGRMPPPEALAGWARRHGFPQEALFVLARAIARRGIKGRFFFRKAHDAVERALPARIQQLANEIERQWGGTAAGGGGR